MNTNIIELKELSSNPNNQGGDHINGEYQVELDKNIVLKDGDNLNIRSAYLDQQATNDGLITIDDTRSNIEIRHHLYLCNVRDDATGFRTVDFEDGIDASLTGKPNGKNIYFM